MKIQTNDTTGELILYPTVEPTKKLGFTIREVAPEIQAVIDDGGGDLKWIPTDSEDVEGSGTLTRLALPVPQSLTPRQFWLSLLAETGLTEAMVEAQIGDNPAALIDLKKATEFRRDYPLLLAMATALEKTAAEVDDIFINGKNL